MTIKIEVQKRATRPRSLRNQLRHSGQIPAVVYGYQIESTPISVNAKTLTKMLREQGAAAVLQMTIDGKTVNTLVYKVTRNTFTSEFEHVEFLSVNMKEATELETEVVLTGESKGVKAGGTITQNLYHVIVSATPDNLPESIEVDITNLEIGDSLTVADLPKNPKYTIVTDGDEQIVAVSEPKAVVEETSDEAIEPEVINEKTDA